MSTNKEDVSFDFDTWRKNFITDEVKAEIEKRGTENCYREKHLVLLHSAMKNHYEPMMADLARVIKGLQDVIDQRDDTKKEG